MKTVSEVKIVGFLTRWKTPLFIAGTWIRTRYRLAWHAIASRSTRPNHSATESVLPRTFRFKCPYVVRSPVYWLAMHSSKEVKKDLLDFSHSLVLLSIERVLSHVPLIRRRHLADSLIGYCNLIARGRWYRN